jgi:hypothetical protein
MFTRKSISAVFIGLFRGRDAREKYLFLIKSRIEQKRQQLFWQKSGDVQLDEMEMKAYHNN